MKHLKILKHTHQLNPGELAGFEDDVAEKLVKSGHAEEFTPEPEKKAAAKSEGGKGESK